MRFRNSRCSRHRCLGRLFAALVLWLQPSGRYGILCVLALQNERYDILSVPHSARRLVGRSPQFSPFGVMLEAAYIRQVAFPCLASDLAILLSVKLCQKAQQLLPCVACV